MNAQLYVLIGKLQIVHLLIKTACTHQTVMGSIIGINNSTRSLEQLMLQLLVMMKI